MAYLKFEDFQIDTIKRILLHNGERVKIPAKSLTLLILLVEKSGEPVSKEEIIGKVWPGDSVVASNTFNVTLRTVRQALGDSGRDPKYILSTPDGYRFIAPVREIFSEPNTGTSDTVVEEQYHEETRGAGLASEEIALASEEIEAKEMSPFGGHFWHVLIACTMYASLYGIALLVETAYQFDRYGWAVLRIAPGAFCWILLTSIAGLAIGRKRTIQDLPGGMAVTLLVLLCSGLALFGVLYQFLPSTPVTQAQFQTHTAQSVYLKEVFYFNTLSLLFLVIPFHFISAVERELWKGKQDSILALLTNSPKGVHPKGVLYIKPQFLGFLLVVITLWALIVRAYVLDQLLPGPYMNPFMGVYYVRLVLFLSLPAYCLAWYFRALNEIKRQSLGDLKLARVE